uniref:Transmembrane protein n=1 Tax=Macrostomum lignano TaxID=282301 RepID=A0A1I8JRI8_9PLAT
WRVTAVYLFLALTLISTPTVDSDILLLENFPSGWHCDNGPGPQSAFYLASYWQSGVHLLPWASVKIGGAEDSIFPGGLTDSGEAEEAQHYLQQKEKHLLPSFCAHSISPGVHAHDKFRQRRGRRSGSCGRRCSSGFKAAALIWLHAAESAGGALLRRGAGKHSTGERPTSLGLSTTLQQRHLQKQHHHSSTASLESTASLGTSTTGSLEPPRVERNPGQLTRSGSLRTMAVTSADPPVAAKGERKSVVRKWRQNLRPKRKRSAPPNSDASENNDGDDDERLCGEQPTLRGLILLTSIFLLSLGGIIVVFASAGLLNFMTLELQQFASLLKVPTELLDSNLNWVYKVLGATGYATANIRRSGRLRGLRRRRAHSMTAAVTSGAVAVLYHGGADGSVAAASMSGNCTAAAARKLTCSQAVRDLSGSRWLMGLGFFFWVLGGTCAALSGLMILLLVSAGQDTIELLLSFRQRAEDKWRRQKQRESPEQRPLGPDFPLCAPKQKNAGRELPGCSTKAAVDRKRAAAAGWKADAPGAEVSALASTVSALCLIGVRSAFMAQREAQADKLRALERQETKAAKAAPAQAVSVGGYAAGNLAAHFWKKR